MATPSLSLVGIGPGDPSLMTLAAVQAIQNATLVAYPVARPDCDGMAVKIAESWITHEKKVQPLVFPMVEEVEPRQEAWKLAGEKLVSLVGEGEQVAFLCQGDVSLFASASYVLLYIKKNYPEFPVKLIPGVTSIAAAAAAGAWPLALQNDQLLVLPAPDDPKTLETLLDAAAYSRRVLALLKLGRRWVWIRPLLERKELLNDALFAQRVGFPDQQVIKASEAFETETHYFSMLLIRQCWPDVLP